MSELIVASGVVGFGMEIVLCIQILRSNIRQKLATWILWAVLEIIVTTSIIDQRGNFLLPAVYALGNIMVVCCIVKSGIFSWTWFDTFVACMAIACMVVWGISGAKIATIASTTAVLIAGVPFVIACYTNPWDNPFLTYIGFLVTNILGVMGGKDWSVEERLYPVSCAGFGLLALMLVARKFLPKQERI